MSNARTVSQPARAPAGADPAAPDLIVHRAEPLNAEPPLARLRAAFLTPPPAFYVRSHGAIPKLSDAGCKLRVGGMGVAATELSLDELRSRFPRRTVTAVLQCAGNRRADLLAVKPVTGDPWRGGAIGNAEWSGVSLGDVLRAAGAGEARDLHVAFESHDESADGGGRYGVSIPLAKALAPETLLAFAMNGEPLRPEHGFPLRVVTPGYAGVRSPKWLASITVQDRPSDNPIQQEEYKLFPPGMSKETAEVGRGVVINDMPLNSVICEPAPHAILPVGSVTVRGYAVATARPVVRVDVSVDGGAAWQQAELERDAGAPWSWTFWTATLDLLRGSHELVVRAWDGAGQTQPSAAADVWNYPGYLSAAWHRVPITVG